MAKNDVLELESKVKDIVIFPGDLNEYERVKGYRVEVIDTEEEDKGFLIIKNVRHEGPKFEDVFPANKYLARSLIALGMEAIVSTSHNFNAQRYRNTGAHDYIITYYGLPVRKVVLKEKLPTKI